MPKRHPGIIKDTNGSWMIQTVVANNGVKKAIKVRGFKSESDAYAEKVRIVNEYKKGIKVKDKPVDFRQLATLYFDDYSSSIKITTMTNRRHSFFRYIVEPYADLPIDYVCNHNTMKAFKESLVAAKISADWVNKLLRFMREIVNYAYQRGYITVTQFSQSNIELKPVYSKKRPAEKRVITQDQFKAFLATFEKHDMFYVMFRLLANVGCRINELRGLQVKHFNRETNVLKIEQQVTSKAPGGFMVLDTKTASSNRSMTLAVDLADELRAYIDYMKYGPDDFLFRTSSRSIDRPVGETTFRRVMQKHFKMIGINDYIKPHEIRHSYTTWLLSDTMTLADIKRVQKRLGHKDINVTLNIYFHLHDDDDSALVEKVKI